LDLEGGWACNQSNSVFELQEIEFKGRFGFRCDHSAHPSVSLGHLNGGPWSKHGILLEAFFHGRIFQPRFTVDSSDGLMQVIDRCLYHPYG
jgi:hypothetical protein